MKNEQTLFFDVLLHGRARFGAAFWCGSAALLRREALVAVGGVATRTVTEDLDTSLVMHRAGWRTVYHDQNLAVGLAPHNLAAYLLQRERWARGTLKVLLSTGSPLVDKAWNWRGHLAFLGNLAYYLMPLQLLTFSAVLVVSLLTGRLPVSTLFPWLLIAWAIWQGTALRASWLLSRGTQAPFDGTSHGWMTASAYLHAWTVVLLGRRSKFKVTPKEGVDHGGAAALRLMWLPAGVLIVVAGALLTRVLDETSAALGGPTLLDRMSVSALLPLSAFTVWEMVVLIRTLVRYLRRRQLRQVWRFDTDLAAELDGTPVRVRDLHEAGASVTWASDCSQRPENGTPMDFRVHLDATDTYAHGRFIPRSCRPDTEQGLRMGGMVDWVSEHDRRAVLSYLYTHVAFAGSESSHGVNQQAQLA